MATAALSVVPARAARPLFVATILTGSFLLFLVQPMVARLALPRLGGAPAVWNSAMLVYQALLLAGYAYAHAIARLAPRLQLGVHVAVLAGAALWLPLGLAAETPPADASPALWVPWLLIISIGPLFFAISAQAPLMQRWFAQSQPGADPYPLYAASNLGSFAGLIAYPLLLEPRLALSEQSLVWTGGYVALLVLVASCALARQPATALPVQAARDDAPAPGVKAWGEWILLAAVPSGLMLATTTHLTTDIVAMPLIWVVPLGIYLLSFSIAFSGNPRLGGVIERAFPTVLVIAAGLVSVSGTLPPFLSAGADLLLLVVATVTLHSALYRRRPAPAHLTGFYLAMSIGGVIGGAFCALAAPLLFDWVYEYPLLILAAGLLLPRDWAFFGIGKLSARQLRWMCVAALLVSLFAGGLLVPDVPAPLRLVALGVLAILARATIAYRWPFALCLIALMLGIGGWWTVSLSFTDGARARSYFGVYSITQSPEVRVLTHGTTVHGMQRRERGAETAPTTYYGPASGVGLAMTAAPQLFGPDARIGVIGLGAGTLACYARPGQEWRFYEIDPAIARIARRQFSFLSRCLPKAPILIGDARLTLAAERATPFDLLVVDAFSSDAVPAHLLTLEAMEVYRARLAPGGVLLIHISNRFMDLAPVLSAAAERGGWHAAEQNAQPAEDGSHQSRSRWVALTLNPSMLGKLNAASAQPWQKLPGRAGFPAWTDDYGSIFPILKLDH